MSHLLVLPCRPVLRLLLPLPPPGGGVLEWVELLDVGKLPTKLQAAEAPKMASLEDLALVVVDYCRVAYLVREAPQDERLICESKLERSG